MAPDPPNRRSTKAHVSRWYSTPCLRNPARRVLWHLQETSAGPGPSLPAGGGVAFDRVGRRAPGIGARSRQTFPSRPHVHDARACPSSLGSVREPRPERETRSEEHTSELQSPMYL